jgi:hypothetical protein
VSKGGRRRRLYYLYIFIALLASKKKKKEKGNLYLVGAPHLLLYFFNSREGVASIGRPPPLQVPTLSLTAGTFAVYLLKKKIYIYVITCFLYFVVVVGWLVGWVVAVLCELSRCALVSSLHLLVKRAGGGGGERSAKWARATKKGERRRRFDL